MTRKSISLPEDVYRKLAEENREGESFGDVIDRLLRGRPLSGFWGAWSEDTAQRAQDAVADGREQSEERLERLYD